MKQNSSNAIYLLLAALCSAVGTGALLMRANNGGTLLVWAVLVLAANILWAAATVLGAKEKTVQRKNPAHSKNPNLPATVEVSMQYLPLYPLLIALAVAVGGGIYTGSAIEALLIFFTWGGFGFPLGVCILRRKTFGTSMQGGLLSAIAATTVAGFIQVFISSSDHTFRLQECFNQIRTGLEAFLGETLQMASELLIAQGIDPSGTIFATPSAELTKELTYSLMLTFPALFAVIVLSVLCLTWWCCKEVLKRSSSVEVKHMGRLDSYVPSRAVSVLYLATYIFYMLASGDVATSAIANNLLNVISLVLMFAGYSLLLFLINTRATSKAMRIVLAVLSALLVFDSCGSMLLVIAGLFSTHNLRQALGGGTLK